MEGLDIIGRVGANVVNSEIDTWIPAFQPETQLVWGDDLSLGQRNTKHSSVGQYQNTSRQSTNLDF